MFFIQFKQLHFLLTKKSSVKIGKSEVSKHFDGFTTVMLFTQQLWEGLSLEAETLQTLLSINTQVKGKLRRTDMFVSNVEKVAATLQRNAGHSLVFSDWIIHARLSSQNKEETIIVSIAVKV
jgi:flagellar capping protein FliD